MPASLQAQTHPGHLEDLLAKVSQEWNASIAAAAPRCFQNCWSSPSPRAQPWVGRAHGDQQILPRLGGAAEKLSKGTSLTCMCSRLTADVEFHYRTELFWLFFVFTGVLFIGKGIWEFFLLFSGQAPLSSALLAHTAARCVLF